MALSLYGERPVAAASSANPLDAIARWLKNAHAARARRIALSALMDLDRCRLDDLGIDRQDVLAALRDEGRAMGRQLAAARAKRARL